MNHGRLLIVNTAPGLAGMLMALCGTLLTTQISLAADNLVAPIATNKQIEVPLPGGADSNLYRWIEWSTDLDHWEPVARDYGLDWETTFPHALPLADSGTNQSLLDPASVGERFFRMGEEATSGIDNSNAVSRFLQQATFGPTRELISTFPGVDSATGFNDPPYTNYENWIDAQIAVPITSLRAFWRERSDPAFTNNTENSPFEVGHNPAYGHQLTYYVGGGAYKPSTNDAIAAGRHFRDVVFSNQETKQIVWYQMAQTADDALRQRFAWALSQVYIVGEEGSNQTQASERWLSYYDLFVRHAFGNLRDILGEVTYHPHMGRYLTFTDNRKADPEAGTFPDENYAREVMQLFTIGLWQLNQDGTLILDGNGDPIPTYTNDDIEEFAKVFTGLRRPVNRTNIEIIGGNYVDPMRAQVNWHDFSTNALLDGSTLGPFPETTDGVRQHIDGLLDHLFNHANTAPFLSRALIQRLTISNPSPNYIGDVAQAFRDGTYRGTGTGQRGDMTAVIKAILLHPEAREPTLSSDSAHGKLREPLIRLLHYARAFEITSPQTYGLLPYKSLDEQIAQSPFDYPTVFNFYLPDYQPNGEILTRDIFAPEFQIHDDITALRLPNAIRTLIYEGIADDIGFRGYSQGDLDLTFEIGFAADTDALLDHLDRMLTAGRLTPSNRSAIFTAIDGMPSGTTAQREARVQRALSLFSLLPEFNVLY